MLSNKLLNFAFNRTTVECKHKIVEGQCIFISTFNRTTVECKLQS